MFIFNLTYMKPISQVEQFLPEHIQFLDEYYKKNVFVCSGRKIPRTGGIILCNCSSKEESEAIMKKDPFYREKIAKYEIIEFVPSKWSDLIQPCLIR
ncbi:YciI family protein [Aminipila sp.]|uniref:YciI family protein n=1 Tax=Aminipila sp. TaxID=2060095 RepID=UPI001D8F34E8|nr:YciI family protein [Aminipila sp.]MBE6033999.1 GTP cyclohydrolase [Clostridiales bacterium]